MRSVRLSLALLAVCLFIVDRCLKQLAVVNPPAADIFFIDKVINPAGPFSWNLPSLVLLLLALPALFWLVHLLLKASLQGKYLKLLGALLMLVGGFSNVWDRLIWGGVVDIWYLPIGDGLHFNLSDVLLLIGFVLLINRDNRSVVAHLSN